MVRSVSDSFVSAPSAINAHCLLQLAELGDIRPSLSKELIESAFLEASSVEQDTPRISAVAEARWLADSNAAVFTSADSQAMDALSLRCRGVLSMLRINPAEARDMFDQIQITITPSTCEDALVPNLDIYFRTLLACYRSFPARRRPDALSWLESHLVVNNAAIIAPASRLVLNIVGDAPTEDLAMKIASDLNLLQPGDRLFMATLQDSTSSIHDLMVSLHDAGLGTQPLLLGWANYLRRCLSAPRCSDSQSEISVALRESTVQAVIAMAGDDGIALAWPVITPGPVSTEQLPTERYWQTAKNKKIMFDYSALRFGTSEQQAEYSSIGRKDNLEAFLPLKERRTPAWLDKGAEFLRELEDWKQSLGEAGVKHFSMVTEMYAALLDVVPSDTPLFQQVLESYIQLLRDSYVQRDAPAVWMLKTTQLISAGFSDATESDLTLIRNSIKQRGNGAMAALVELNLLLHPQTKRSAQ